MTAEDATEHTKTSKRRRPRSRGRVTVFPNWCKGCNLCVEFCPTHVLEQGEDGRVIVADPEKCTACRWCELHCPDFAIFVQALSSSDDMADVSSVDETATIPSNEAVAGTKPEEEAA